VTQGGPADPGFNEFTPRFERQQAQLNATGVVGNNETYGGEGAVSMVYDRYSLSAGAFHFQTDGWRPNNDIDHDIVNFFGQAAITPKLNAQIELRSRDSDEGDLALNFDPDDFDPDERRDLDQDTGRVGLRYSASPASDFLLSFIYSDRTERKTDVIGGDQQIHFVDDGGYQGEAPHPTRRGRFNLTSGIGSASVDRRREFEVPGFADTTDADIEQPRGYLYGNLNLPDPVTWTLGVSVDHYEEQSLDLTKVNPKLGVRWNITEDLALRGAAFRTIK